MLDTFKRLLGDNAANDIHCASTLAGLIATQQSDVSFHASMTIIGQALTPYIVGNILTDTQ